MKRRHSSRPVRSLSLVLERLEDRRLLSVSDPNDPGNDCAPELDLTGLDSNELTISAGAATTFNLYDIGATLEDTQDGATFNDFAAGRLLLKGDAALTNASLSTAGEFSFTPTTEQTGTSVSFTVMALDRPTDRTKPPRVDTETFTITVEPANQAPSFTMGGDQTVDEDPSPAEVTIAGFATNIDDGDAGVTQALTFNLVITPSTPGLFVAGGEPKIDPSTGDLTFTPAADANGTADVSVTLSDDGGTALGGVDTSAAQTFTITITAVNDAPVIAVPSSPQAATEDTPATIPGIVVSDIDAEETAGAEVTVTLTVTDVGVLSLPTQTGLTFTDDDGDDSVVFSGSLTDVNNALAELTYQGAQDFNGTATVDVVVSDQGNTGAIPFGQVPTTASFTIDVAAVDDIPVLSGVNDQSALDSEPLLLDPITVSDVDLDGGDVEMTLSVDAGTLALSSMSGITLTSGPSGDGSTGSPLTLRGTVDQVNLALKRILFTPDSGAASVALTVGANDQPDTSATPRTTATATLTVVEDTNNAPVITDPLPAVGDSAVLLEPTQDDTFEQVFTVTDDPGENVSFTVSAEAGFTVPEGLFFGAAIEVSPGVYEGTLTWPQELVAAGTFEHLFVNVADNGIGSTGLGAKSDTVAVTLQVTQVITVNTTNDTVDADANDGKAEDANGDISLRAAIQHANATPGKAIIKVPAGTYALEVTGADEDAAVTGDLDITDELVIQGDDAATTIIDAGGDATGALGDRVFDIRYVGTTSLSNLTITGGRADEDGGGIRSLTGSALTLSDSVVSNNETSVGGGGIYAEGDLSINASTIRGNKASYGGGIAGRSSLILNDSTVKANTALVYAGGIDLTEGFLGIEASHIQGNTAGSSGGGISVWGDTTIATSTISGNTAGANGGGIELYQATATIRDSTLSGNTAELGGGVYTNASTTSQVIVNSTISGNTATTAGGGVLVDASNLIIEHSTITANDAPEGAGVGVTASETETTRLGHSIVAGNTSGADVAVVDGADNALTSAGYNIVGTGNTFDTTQSALDNFVATGDQTGVADPMLGPLQDNGGATETHAPLPLAPAAVGSDSPAINGGDAAFDPATFTPDLDSDQRGAARVNDGMIDVGAFETDLLVDNVTDNNDDSLGDGQVGDGPGNRYLRAAIQEANFDADHTTIILPEGTYVLGRQGADDAALFGDLDITADVTIIGAGAGRTIITAIDDKGTLDTGDDVPLNDRVFHILGGAKVHLVGVTVTGGTVADDDGGGILVEDGELKLVESEVRDNATTGTSIGGGISVAPDGVLTVLRSTIANNESVRGGGGIDNFRGEVTVISSTISGNNVTDGGQSGGGIRNNTGPLKISSSTITDNRALGGGAGVSHSGAAGTLVLQNSIIADNIINAADSDLLTLSDSVVTSLGHNLVGHSFDNPGLVDGVNGDQVGTITAPLLADLAPLAHNGGPTRTHALLDGSLALDAGNADGLFVDQRGADRTVDLDDATYANVSDATDIGAYEAQVVPAVPVTASASGAVHAVAVSQSVQSLPIQQQAAPPAEATVTGLDPLSVEFVDLAAGRPGRVSGPTIYLNDAPAAPAPWAPVDGAFSALATESEADVRTGATPELELPLADAADSSDEFWREF